MRKTIAILTVLATLLPVNAWSVGKIQNEDVKSLTDLTNAGSDQTHLIHTDKIYDIANSQQLSTSISNGQLGGGSGAGQGIELLSNPGFELGITQGWTATGGTLTVVTSGSNLMFDKKSASWTASASGQKLESGAIAIQGLSGGGCQAELHYLYSGSSGDYSFEVTDGTNVLATQSLTPNSVASSPVDLYFACGSAPTSTLRAYILSNVSSPSAIINDNWHLGSTGLQAIQQSKFYGSAKTAATASCTWGPLTANTPTAFSATSACPTPTLVGQAQAPATKVPGITFATMPPGDYLFIAHGAFYENGGNQTYHSFYFGDGTNLSTNNTITVAGPSSSLSVGSLIGHIAYSTTQSNVTVQLYGKTPATDSVVADATVADFEISVYYFPSQSQTVQRGDQLAASWSGYHNSSCSWSNTGTSFSTPAGVGGGCALVESTNRNFGTVVTQGSVQPGITFTPPKAGNYFVCANISAFGTTVSSDQVGIQLTDGTAVIAQGSSRNQTGGLNPNMGTSLCGVWTAASVSPVTLTVQTKQQSTDASSLNAGLADRAIGWSVVQLDAGQPSAFVPGSIFTGNSGSTRTVLAKFGGVSEASACSSSPCTIYRQSGADVTSVTRTGAGAYTVNFAAGAFSQPPICSCNSYSTNSAVTCVLQGETSSSMNLVLVNLSGIQTDDAAAVTCSASH